MFFVKMVSKLGTHWYGVDVRPNGTSEPQWFAERESAKKFDTQNAAAKIALEFPGAFVVVE